MVRKRDYYTRLRAKRVRPKTPAPTNGWVIAELARLSHVPVRRLRYYVEHRLIEPMEFRGTATRYPRRELLRVLGFVRLRAETGAKLAVIKRKLDMLGERELEEWLSTQPVPAEAAAALGMSLNANAPGDASPAPSASSRSAASTWQRVCLLPGLELMIAAQATPAVLRAADRICKEYIGSPIETPAQPN